MNPRPDHGEQSYRGSGRLKDKKVLIDTGHAKTAKAYAEAPAAQP